MATRTIRVNSGQDPVSVFVHELQSSVILVAGAEFNADHPVVAQCPWAFGDDVEDASAAPGRRRNVKRVADTDDD